MQDRLDASAPQLLCTSVITITATITATTTSTTPITTTTP
jgi:hypothetical protein